MKNKNNIFNDGDESFGQAIETTYMIVTGQLTLENIQDKGRGIFMMYDPTNLKEKELKDILEDIIEYYIDTEEYEKCQKVKQLLNSNLKDLIAKITYKKEDAERNESSGNPIDQMIDVLRELTKNQINKRMDNFFNPDQYKEFLRGPINNAETWKAPDKEKDLGFANLELWSMMSAEDRSIFDDNYDLFSDWTSKLKTKQRNFYTERLLDEKPLIPPYKEREIWNTFDPGVNSQQSAQFDFEEKYKSEEEIDYNSMVVSFIDNYTCISNYSLAKIHKIKFQLLTYGVLDIELRNKKVKGKVVYTLVFDGRQDSRKIDWS